MKYFAFSILFVCLLCSCVTDALPVLENPNDPAAPRKSRKFLSFHLPTRITDKTFDGKIYVADFIFLSCPTNCPKMNVEMHKAYKEFENDDRILFISHTIDSAHDSVPQLKAFAQNLGVSSNKWHFVTDNLVSIYVLAEKNYFTSAYPDSSDARNFIHGGGLLLVDKYKHICGVYDGTNQTETVRLIKDIICTLSPGLK